MHSAMRYKKKRVTNHSLSSGRHDSNVRPLGPKPSILPTVLRPECFRKSECKDSASRTIFQIYLRKSEAQPILRLRKQAKVVQKPNDFPNLNERM